VPILATIKILIDELWIKPQEERSGNLIVDPARADDHARREPGTPSATDEERRTVPSTAS
jgi:hypothetical protein